jgi:glycerate dehydrogenase
MKIVVLDGHTLSADDNPWTALHRLGEVELYDRSTPEEVAGRARGAAVLITNKARVPGAVIDAAAGLRFIAVSATGYDCVDVAAAARRGVPVSNVPEYGTASVAQYVFALLLHLGHRVGLHADLVRAGAWARAPDFCFWKTPQVEWAGKTLGVVGFGRIGRRVAELAHAFGMAVLAAGRSPREAPAYGPFAWADLDDLFARSDAVTLHCPLTEATAGLVDRRRLRLMKPGAFLVNTSRGGLVDEGALAEALNEGRLAGAAVDVVSREPILPDHPLLTAPNCFITPHIAWATREARRRLLEATVANVAAFLSGRPTNVVNGVGLG